MTGTIFNVQRFCLQDGPGIRTTVFMKGCPLRCQWCHNPESHSARPQLLYDPARCIGCGACARVCERHGLSESGHAFDRVGCTGCGKCAAVCAAGALELSGRTASVDELLDEVERDRIFFSADGGMTLSGGEPTAQPEFAIALAEGAKARGMHVCVETCGFCDFEILKRLSRSVDLFLYDVKLMDDELHKAYTGVSNQRILENLRRLDELGAATILRCPMIPDVNVTDGHLLAVAALAEELQNVREIQLEPYHPLGLSKSARLGQKAAYENGHSLDRSALTELVEAMKTRTHVAVSIQ